MQSISNPACFSAGESACHGSDQPGACVSRQHHIWAVAWHACCVADILTYLQENQHALDLISKLVPIVALSVQFCCWARDMRNGHAHLQECPHAMGLIIKLGVERPTSPHSGCSLAGVYHEANTLIFLQENQHAMDLISKLDLEKAQLQRVTQSNPVAANTLWSPGKGTDALSMPELQKRLAQETAQRQQVRLTAAVFCLAVAAVHVSGSCHRSLFLLVECRCWLCPVIVPIKIADSNGCMLCSPACDSCRYCQD